MAQIGLCGYKLNFCFGDTITGRAIDPSKGKRAVYRWQLMTGQQVNCGEAVMGRSEDRTALEGIDHDSILQGKSKFTKDSGVIAAALPWVSSTG